MMSAAYNAQCCKIASYPKLQNSNCICLACTLLTLLQTFCVSTALFSIHLTLSLCKVNFALDITPILVNLLPRCPRNLHASDMFLLMSKWTISYWYRLLHPVPGMISKLPQKPFPVDLSSVTGPYVVQTNNILQSIFSDTSIRQLDS